MDRHRPRRAGFTLIELLITILIIGALMAILVPTVFAAFRKAKEAACSAEINNLATALADFKSKFGEYPPSRLLLCEAGYSPALLASSAPIQGPFSGNSTVVDITEGLLAARSLLYLRKFFPRCTFAPTTGTTPTTFYDFNGDGYAGVAAQNTGSTTYYVLNGAECMAFFLGGMPAYKSGGVYQNNGLVGFGRQPTNPFVDSATQPNNRTQPLFEFNQGRLVDVDLDGIPTYLDAFSQGNDQVPYAYFYSYGSNSYDPNDVNDNGHAQSTVVVGKQPTAQYNTNVETDDNGTILYRGFSVSFAGNGVVSTSPNPYTSTGPVSTTGANYYNANSFQLFSAGQDRLWGLGGLYLPANPAGRLPLYPKTATGGQADPGNTNNEDQSIRLRESDNLTNFSGGRLD